MNNENYEEFINIIEKFNNTKVEHIKNNLYDILRNKHLRYTILGSILNISEHTARSYINQSIKSKPSIDNILKVCLALGISIEDLMIENERTLGNQGRTAKKWDSELINSFIKDFEEEKELSKVSEKYSLAEGTCIEYYRLFKRKIEEKNIGE